MSDDGRFKPGESGNPAGRPKGSGQIGQLRAAIAEHVPDIVTRLVDAAKAGDVPAARLLLERVLPPIRASEEPAPLTLPSGTFTEQGRAVLVAAGAGELAPSQAAQLLSGLASLAKLTETDELMRRIAALEERNGNPVQSTRGA